MDRLNFNVRSTSIQKYSIFANYSLGFTDNDTDGGFPAYTYDLSGEWGRASFDTRHSFVIGGNFQCPLGSFSEPVH